MTEELRLLREIHQMLKEIIEYLKRDDQNDFVRNIIANLVANELERKRNKDNKILE